MRGLLTSTGRIVDCMTSRPTCNILLLKDVRELEAAVQGIFRLRLGQLYCHSVYSGCRKNDIFLQAAQHNTDLRYEDL